MTQSRTAEPANVQATASLFHSAVMLVCSLSRESKSLRLRIYSASSGGPKVRQPFFSKTNLPTPVRVVATWKWKQQDLIYQYMMTLSGASKFKTKFTKAQLMSVRRISLYNSLLTFPRSLVAHRFSLRTGVLQRNQKTYWCLGETCSKSSACKPQRHLGVSGPLQLSHLVPLTQTVQLSLSGAPLVYYQSCKNSDTLGSNIQWVAFWEPSLVNTKGITTAYIFIKDCKW